MGWTELLRVLGTEAEREAAAARAAADREAARVVAEARAAAAAARQALLARERAEAEARRRAAAAEAALLAERAVLSERRRLLGELRRAAAGRLEATPLSDDDLARLLGELLAGAPPGPLVVRCDPGDEARLREALRRGHPGEAARVEVRPAAARRGGLELEAGRLWLDSTLPARLARAWPALERELARRLFGEVA